MQSTHDKLNQFFEFAPQFLLPLRWVVLCLFILITGFSIYSMITKFEMDMSLESWFQDDDPTKLSLDEFRRQFGSDDGVYIVYKAKDGDVFSSKSLAILGKLHEQLDDARLGLSITEESKLSDSQLTRIERIESLINIRYQLADGDTLISKKLVGKSIPKTQKSVESIRGIANSQENMALAFYSKDYQFGGIRLKTDFGLVPKNEHALDTEADLFAEDEISFDDDLEIDTNIENESIEFRDMQMNEYLTFMKELKSITKTPDFEHFEFYYSGNAPMMEFFTENMNKDMFLVLLVVLVVGGLLWFLFHSLSAVVWPIVVIAGSAFWMIGLSAAIGVTFSTMVSLSFMLVLAVGVADCVHVLSAYILYKREGFEHRKAMTMAYRKTGLPILLTTVTTMMGMMALNISDIPQIGVFGATSAAGVFVAFLLTIFVLPVLLDIWHPYGKKRVAKIVKNEKRHWLKPLLDALPDFVEAHHKKIVIGYFFVFALFIYGASQVKIDSNIAELTREGSSIRVTYEIIDNNMMGGQSMEVMLDFQQDEALKNAQVLKQIDYFERHLTENYPEYVIKTFSLAQFVKDTHRVMNEGSEEFYSIPDNNRLVAQLLYLFDNANPEDRRSLVSDNYSKSHISIQLKNAGSYEYNDFFNNVQNDIGNYFGDLNTDYPNMNVNSTGSLTLMMKMIDHISWTQIKSFSFALIIITCLLMFTLGSIQAGYISIVPNLLPAFFSFGTMGLLGIPLDTDTLIIAPLIIGIAVDDTIHFVAHYRDAWFRYGSSDKALKETLKEVGQAVTFTTLILGIGFSILSFSDYLGLAKTGIFGSLAIFVALSSDLLLLPALVKWFKPDLGRSRYIQQKGVEHA